MEYLTVYYRKNNFLMVDAIEITTEMGVIYVIKEWGKLIAYTYDEFWKIFSRGER